MRLFTISLAILLSVPCLARSRAPGAPGDPHRWSPASKQALGSAFEAEGARSPVWFTVAEGIVSEVFYPTVDQPQVAQLEFLVTDGKSFVSEQRYDTISHVRFAGDGMTVEIRGEDRSGAYRFEQEIVTDPKAPVLRLRTTFQFEKPNLQVYFWLKPGIGNNGANDEGTASRDALSATDRVSPLVHSQERVALALVASGGWSAASTGFIGSGSDGLLQLRRDFSLSRGWSSAGPGNIGLIGQIPEYRNSVEVALGFGGTQGAASDAAADSLRRRTFDQVRASYEAGWKSYPAKPAGFLAGDALALQSVKLLKMHEDKRTRGALVAALVTPDLPGNEVADDEGFYLGAGYHVVWPRDLFHSATGLLAAGDFATVRDIVSHYARTQKPDGSWPQNMWVDGTPCWESLQMDEVSFPVLLTALLSEKAGEAPTKSSLRMVKRAAKFLMQNGPSTPLDRWEEVGGYSPATLADEIAALRAAAQLWQRRDPRLSADFAARADDWSAKLESWVLVSNGPWGKDYYLRVSPKGTPNVAEPIQILKDRIFDSRELIDSGFLELVRRGVRNFADPRILNTLRLYESPALEIAAQSALAPGAMIYRQYNHGAYGADAIGGYWPLLTGERGVYAVAAGDLSRAEAQLRAIAAGTTESGLIPEQLISAPEAGQPVRTPKGGATPLAWSHAEYLVLGRSIQEQAVFDRVP